MAKKVINISTRTGDQGETSLVTGRRLPKSNPIFEAVGTIDELNSWLGLIVAKIDTECQKEREFLLEAQDTLFYVGAELAGSKEYLTQKHLDKVEKNSLEMQTRMADNWHSRFVLPGGTELSAEVDIARTVTRRAERVMVALNAIDPVRPVLLKYVNRLSDYLYVFRCFINQQADYKEKEFISDK